MNVRFFLSILTIFFLTFIIILQLVYYNSRNYLFDPFLQIHYPKHDFEIVDDEILVLCLGGSTTNDGRLLHNEKYPTILQMKLNEKFPDKKIRVINAGMDWYTSRHSLINYTTYYRKVNPDFVLVMHAINDICRSFSPAEFSIGEFLPDYSHYYGPAMNAACPPTLTKYLVRNFLGDSKYQEYFFSLEPEYFDMSEFRSLDSYKYNMATLVQNILNDKTKCLLIEQPSFYQIEMDDQEISKLWFGRSLCNQYGKEYPNHISMKNAMDVYNNAADSISCFYNVPFVYTNNFIPKKSNYFKDDVHHTSLTTNQLVDLILPFIDM